MHLSNYLLEHLQKPQGMGQFCWKGWGGVQFLFGGKVRFGQFDFILAKWKREVSWLGGGGTKGKMISRGWHLWATPHKCVQTRPTLSPLYTGV